MMDLKPGGYQGLREPGFILPSLGTFLSAPAVSQHVPAPGREGRSKPISQATEKKEERGAQDCTSGGHWLFLAFKLPFKTVLPLFQ